VCDKALNVAVGRCEGFGAVHARIDVLVAVHSVGGSVLLLLGRKRRLEA
jgi:hypothetical protein